ncbi:MAG: hypothetical protein ACOYNL_07170 [Rickettsiales bacterium]
MEKWRENPWDRQSSESARQYEERMEEWNLTGGGRRPDETAQQYEERLAEMRLTGGQRSDEGAYEYETRLQNAKNARNMTRRPDESWRDYELRRNLAQYGQDESYGRYPDLD